MILVMVCVGGGSNTKESPTYTLRENRMVDGYVRKDSYLEFHELADVWHQEEFDAINCSWQEKAPYEEYGKEYVGHYGSHIYYFTY